MERSFGVVVPNWALIDTEQSTEHPSLPMQVLSGDPKHLPFANHLHRLDSRNDAQAVTIVRKPCMARKRRLTCR